MERDRDISVRMAVVLAALVGCAEESLAGDLDASGRMNSTPFRGTDDALADAEAIDPDAASSAGAEAGAPASSGSPTYPFLCKIPEPCGVLVIVPGDCAARTLTPCSERQESFLSQRLLRNCGYDPSYNPLEVSFEAGCVTMFRYAANSKTDNLEIVDCLRRELGALRFDCADGGRLLLYRDTLALP